MAELMDDIVEQMETLYLTVGFGGVLEALNIYLLRRCDTSDRLMGERDRDLERQWARLKKARLPLTSAEDAEVHTRGLLWFPIWSND